MPDYRRAFQPGGTFFLTVVTERRQRILTSDTGRALLRSAISLTKSRYPFEIPAMVLLPDHVHMIWTLPCDNADFSRRMALLKKEFTKGWRGLNGLEQPVSPSRRRDRRCGVWQRRFWEHLIRDDNDFIRHCDYIHYNPVKHGLADCPHAWPYSSFHRFVQADVYPRDWRCACGAAPPPPPGFDDIAETARE